MWCVCVYMRMCVSMCVCVCVCCYRELLEMYSNCKTSVEVIACQQKWLSEEQEKQVLSRHREGNDDHKAHNYYVLLHIIKTG